MREVDARLDVLEQAIDVDVELQWQDDALAGRPRAVLWHGVRGLSVPRSYRRHQRLEAVRAEFALRGWPVSLRRSGGGVVPQGEGLLNLSLALPIDGGPGERSEQVYARLCGVLARALAACDIDARPGAVEGSFCDGRYNLAVRERKIAGTAQHWRRAAGRQAVLAHALLLVDADLELLVAQANAFEAALGSKRRYRIDAHTTVAAETRADCSGARLALHIAGALEVDCTG